MEIRAILFKNGKVTHEEKRRETERERAGVEGRKVEVHHYRALYPLNVPRVTSEGGECPLY